MIEPQILADRYVAVWNETDPTARRAAIERLWPVDGLHYVKTLESCGHDALEKRIDGSHQKNVRDGGFRFRAVRNAQALHDVVTFNWEMFRPETGETVATGLEFLRLDTDGLILCDYQFFMP